MLTKFVRNVLIKKIEIKGFSKLLLHSFKSKPISQKNSYDDINEVDKKKLTVSDIPRNRCIGCGLCSSVCGLDAIKMDQDEIGFIPSLNADKCINCGLCYKVCPGINKMDYPGKLGSIEKIFVGHLKNSKERYAASSGGACRAILKYLLENNIVDGVIITRASDDPYNPETIITSSVEDISGNKLNSVYSPTKPLEALRNIDKNSRYAIVGLPCHIAGLSLASKFKKNIYLTIGLFCSHTPGFGFVNSLLKDTVLQKNIDRIRYRGEGWPGKSGLYHKDGTQYKIHFPALWHEYNYMRKYEQPRCKECTYYSAEFADISLGDPWVLASKDKVGSSLIFSRTKKGTDIINCMGDYMELFTPEGDEKTRILQFHEESIEAKLK